MLRASRRSSWLPGKRTRSVRPLARSRSRHRTLPRARLRGRAFRNTSSSFRQFAAHHVKFLSGCTRDGEVRRQRPRRRRPDDDARFARELAAHDRKLHIDRRILAVLIFHFRLRERGLRAGAPEDRLLGFRRRGPSPRSPRRRGGSPLRTPGSSVRYGCSQSPNTPSRLNCSRWMSMNLRANASRLLPHFERGKPARFLHDLEFDRQPVAVPARHIRRAETGHRFRFHDQILEDLVQRRAHVDVAIGEGRAVVQHEQRPPLRAPPGSARKAGSPPTASAVPARA